MPTEDRAWPGVGAGGREMLLFTNLKRMRNASAFESTELLKARKKPHSNTEVFVFKLE